MDDIEKIVLEFQTSIQIARRKMQPKNFETFRLSRALLHGS